MAPKFGKASPTPARSKKPLRSAGHFSLSTDVIGGKPKSPLSQLYEQKPFGFSPSSPRSLIARQEIAGLSQDVRLQEMSTYVTSRGGTSLPVLVPEDPMTETASALVDSALEPFQSQNSMGFQHVRSQKTMKPNPSQPELRTSESFGFIEPELTGFSFRATTGVFVPRGTKGGWKGTAGSTSYRTGLRSMKEKEDGPVRPESGDRPSTRETVAVLRAEGLGAVELQTKRLAKLAPKVDPEDVRGVRQRTPPLAKNQSMPDLHKSRHETEVSKQFDGEVDRWLRRLMVDVNISHKSLPESSAQSQICSHMDKVHRWFDRSKKVATHLKESAGEKKPVGPSLKQAGLYLPSGTPAPPGSLHWERPRKPMKLSESDVTETPFSDLTTDPGETDVEGDLEQTLSIACP